MDPNDFLALAEELVERKTAACCRAAVGRAYYGALNVVGDLLRQAALPVAEGPSAHQKIWQDFINCGIADLEVAGSQLSELHGKRIEADYKMRLIPPESYQTAKYWVVAARENTEIIKRFFSAADRARTISAIQAYRSRVGR